MLHFLKWILFILIGLLALIFVFRWFNARATRELTVIKESTRAAYAYAEGLSNSDLPSSDLSGVSVSEILGETIHGYRFKPDEVRHKGAVVLFGGSDGGVTPYFGALLASEGYDVYAMRLFSGPNQSPELIEIPVEMFEEALEFISSAAEAPSPLTLIGSSKGAEFSLLLSTVYPDAIDHLVLYVPSSHVWSGVSRSGGTSKSSWTKNGEAIPCLELNRYAGKAGFDVFLQMIGNKPFRLEPMYSNALLAPEADAYRIDTQNAKADLLIFAGALDGVWPSAGMGEMIKESYPGDCQLYTFDQAGHIFLGPSVFGNLETGGIYEANESAHLESNKILLEKMEEWTR